MPVYDRSNVFARILRGEAPSTRVYEDEFALAFRNIHPRTPIHVVVVPKGEYVSHADFSASAPHELIVGFWRAVGRTAAALGLEQRGYRIITNHGSDANQVVFHYHVHMLGGRQMGSVSGPPGPGDGT